MTLKNVYNYVESLGWSHRHTRTHTDREVQRENYGLAASSPRGLTFLFFGTPSLGGFDMLWQLQVTQPGYSIPIYSHTGLSWTGLRLSSGSQPTTPVSGDLAPLADIYKQQGRP